MIIAGIAIQYCNVRAVACAQGEVSLIAPLQALTPGLVTVMGLVLGEYPGWSGIVGIVCMSIGTYILLWDGKPKFWYEYFGPFRYLSRLIKFRSLTLEQQGKTMAVCWSLGSASLGTIGLLFGGLFTRRALNFQGLTFGAFIEVLVYASAFIVWFFIRPDTKENTRSLQAFATFRRAKPLMLLLLIAGAWVAHMWLINPAFQQTYVVHVGTLKRFSVLTSVALGLFLYKEQAFAGGVWRVVLQPRFWAASLAILGVVFIASDNLPSRITTAFEGLGF